MRSRLRVMGMLLSLSLLTQLAACGSVFYPDRRGQIDGKIDPLIAGLDAVGLLFYIVPGVIALGIDFTTGAIYIPNTRYSMAPSTLREAIGADGQIDHRYLKTAIARETGQNLPLDDPRMQHHFGTSEQLASYGLPSAL